MKNTHCRMWNVARNTEKLEKLKMHNVGTGIWRETLNHGKRVTNTVGREYGEKN